MAKRGRRPGGEYPEKKRVFASRIREDTWKMLERAAARSGRSISQEFEHQIRRGLDEDKWIEEIFGDRRTFGLMKMAAMAAVNSAFLNPKDSKAHWTSNVETFDRALNAIVNALRFFRPHKKIFRRHKKIFRPHKHHELVAADLVTVPPEISAPTLKVVREIQAADPVRPLDKMSKRQRAMLRLKDELGDLVDRPLQAEKGKTGGEEK